jgi:nucleoside-diphosphate-sugar epimerase
VSNLIAEVRPNYLLHLAWDVEPGKYLSSVENLRWTEASLTLLRAFAEQGGRRAVMAGTCAEYDSRFGYCVEDLTPVSPVTLYGACKNALREVGQRFAAETGVSALWVRLFYIYGPDEAPGRLVPSIIAGLMQKTAVPCTRGDQIRDYLHVQDAAEALAALVDCQLEGVVNLASGQPIAIREVIRYLAHIIGGEELLQWGAVQVSPHDPLLLVADVKRLTRATGWRPCMGLETGLRMTVDWWRRTMGQ